MDISSMDLCMMHHYQQEEPVRLPVIVKWKI